MSWHKCYYQLDDCENWTDDDLTLGTSRSWVGPPGPDGFSTLTLAEYDAPICRACLDAHPEPLVPELYYGDPATNPEAEVIPVPHIRDLVHVQRDRPSS